MGDIGRTVVPRRVYEPAPATLPVTEPSPSEVPERESEPVPA